MLKALVRHPRQPLSREKLAQLARGREFEPFDRSLDVQISRLRKLIEPDPAAPRYIQTVWGVGYVFVPDGAALTLVAAHLARPTRSPAAFGAAARSATPVPDLARAPPAPASPHDCGRRSRLSLFWRTFFLLALLLVGSVSPGCRPSARWSSSRAPCRRRSRSRAWSTWPRGAVHADAIARVSLIKTLADQEGVRIAAARAAATSWSRYEVDRFDARASATSCARSWAPARWWRAASTARKACGSASRSSATSTGCCSTRRASSRVGWSTWLIWLIIARWRRCCGSARDRAADQPAAQAAVVRRQPRARRRLRCAASTRTR